MKPGILLLSLILVLFGCESSDQVVTANSLKSSSTLTGLYSGIFFRSHPFGRIETSNVSLIFGANEFSGESDHSKYPAICHGTVGPGIGTLDFTNECYWTAEFDWTLILHGKFDVEIRGDSLYLSKQIDENTWDYYQLALIQHETF